MKLILLIWLFSIPAWFGFMLLLNLLHNFLTSKSSNSKRKLFYDIGFLFTGTGGVGALLGITGQTSDYETALRASMAFVLILFGVIMILLNVDE